MLLNVLQVYIILNFFFFSPELQLKKTECAIKNKKKVLLELRGFKFVTTLFLIF